MAVLPSNERAPNLRPLDRLVAGSSTAIPASRIRRSTSFLKLGLVGAIP